MNVISSWVCKKCGKQEIDIVAPEVFHLCPPSVYRRERKRSHSESPKSEPARLTKRRSQVTAIVNKGGFPVPTTRHLLYHVYPSKKNDIWRDNIRRVVYAMNLFNGRRCVAVATSTGTYGIDEVKKAFGDCDIEYTVFDNDPMLREVATFPALIGKCQRMLNTDVVFYAHTKGNSTSDNVHGSTIWRGVGYEHLLDRYYEKVEPELKTYAAVGIHHMIWPWDAVKSPFPTNLRNGNWMFAGTFFWFRPSITHNCDDWRNVPVDRYGAEAWLSGLLPHDVTKSVYQLWDTSVNPWPSPYDPWNYPEQDQIKYGGKIFPRPPGY